jgi:hypothetical protein
MKSENGSLKRKAEFYKWINRGALKLKGAATE